MRRKNLSESLEMFASQHGLQETVNVRNRDGLMEPRKIPSAAALARWREERARLLGITNHTGPCPTKPVPEREYWLPRASEL